MIGALCADHDWPDAGLGMCCMGAAMRGPGGCTCWEAVYDLDQQPARRRRPAVRAEQCEDCAYRADSPERNDDPKAAGDGALLDSLAASPEHPFWCHQGIRRPLLWRHVPADCTTADLDSIDHNRVAELPGDPMNYCPPLRWKMPYKADGTPADQCAGWAVRAGRAS